MRYLNEEEPWKDMSAVQVGRIFGQSFDVKKMKGDILKLEEDIKMNKDEHVSNSVIRIEKLKSQVEIIALCKTFSIIRYNRDFDEYKITQLKKQLETTKKQLDRKRASWNYKIGSFITWLPKRIYYALGKKVRY